MGNACGGCFSGLSAGGSSKNAAAAAMMAADDNPQRHVGQVSTFQEAMQLERNGSGTFLPAPTSPNIPNTQAVDLDLVIEEAGIPVRAGKPSLATQLDTDKPGRMHLQPGMERQTSKFEAQQILNSPAFLPKPMTTEEREAAIRKILPTATYEMLAKVPQNLLKASNAEGQTLRRKLAHGATLVVFSAGLAGKRFTFERAAAMGMKVVVIEHPDSWAASLVQEGVIAKFLPVDMSQDSEKVFQEALGLIRNLGRDGVTGPADGIATFVELAVPLVSRLTEALALPGHRPGAVDAARDKHATRATMKAAGLPTPRNYLIKTPADVAAADKAVGFPAVLKPVSGAASLGVKKVVDSQDMVNSYNEIIAELKTLVVSSGALVKGDGNSGVDASNMVDLTVLMEQYLDGPEVDVDVVMSDGDWVYAAVADNGPTMEPYFNETWGLCPSMLPKDHQRQLKELGISAVKCLGFTSGVFHVECKMTSTGPQLIEVNSRMGGGQVHECNLRCWGVDLVEETLFAALGIPARPPVPKAPLTAAAYCYVNAPFSGQVHDLSKLESLQGRKDVVWAKPLVKPGAKVVGPEEGLPTWLCDLFVTKPEAKDALAFLQSLEADNPVPVQK